jgi:hypothetical protein
LGVFLSSSERFFACPLARWSRARCINHQLTDVDISSLSPSQSAFAAHNALHARRTGPRIEATKSLKTFSERAFCSYGTSVTRHPIRQLAARLDASPVQLITASHRHNPYRKRQLTSRPVEHSTNHCGFYSNSSVRGRTSTMPVEEAAIAVLASAGPTTCSPLLKLSNGFISCSQTAVLLRDRY